MSKLTDTIKGLNTAITTPTETIMSLQATVSKQPLTVNQNPIDTLITKTVDRSLNIVMYGIEEPLPTIPKSDRDRSDLANTLPVLSTIDSSIQNASISDLYRQGRFDENQTRPRPILVKFLHRMDVTTILSNRNKIKKLIAIKADMSKEERTVESLLLQEHWKLIQQGTSRKHITIQRSEMYVGKLLHAKVTNLKFVLCKFPANTTNVNPASSTSVEMEMEHADT